MRPSGCTVLIDDVRVTLPARHSLRCETGVQSPNSIGCPESSPRSGESVAPLGVIFRRVCARMKSCYLLGLAIKRCGYELACKLAHLVICRRVEMRSVLSFTHSAPSEAGGIKALCVFLLRAGFIVRGTGAANCPSLYMPPERHCYLNHVDLSYLQRNIIRQTRYKVVYRECDRDISKRKVARPNTTLMSDTCP